MTVTEKGKFKWAGPFDVLQKLMKDLIEKKGRWTTPVGYCKLLDLDEVVVRWYMDSKSFTINGSSSEDIKSQLFIIAKLIQRENLPDNVEDKKNIEPSKVNVEDVSKPSSDNLKDEDKLELLLINTIRNIEERLENKINSLANELCESKLDLVDVKRSIIENQAANLNANSDRTLTVESCLEERKSRPKEQNNGLREQLSTYKCIVSDLNART